MTILSITMTWTDVLVASLICVIIVFSALVILSSVFKLIGVLSLKRSKRRMQKQQDLIEGEVVDPSDIPASEIAAISMALHLYFDDVHDKESNILTIKRIERRYSPWNSKIYGLTNNLNR